MLPRNTKLVYLLIGLVVHCASSGFANFAYLECYHCDGADCYAPTVQTCASTGDKGQCFMYFEPQSGIATRMGCISSLAADATKNAGMNYFLCDGNFCNNYYNLPPPRTCYVCNSAEDVNCAVDPTAINTKTMCNIQPHTDCVSLIDEAGQTIRGCFSSLNNTEFVACNEATPEVVCRICTDDNCNGDLYPKSRLSCNRCNSADDPSCASNPAAPAICPTYSAADYCVSKLVDGIVYRDCATELKCDTQSTNSTCRQCSEDNCNTNVFASPVGASRNVRTLDSKISADSAYLECYQCAVDNCYAPTVETCASTSDKGQCYMYFEPQSSIATRMGCISSLAADATNNDGMNYFLCDGNFCNSYYNLPLATTCYVCNSAEDVNCAVDPTAINTQAMCNIQPHTECVSLVDEAGQTIRGCFSSLNNTEFVACNEATPEVVCRICTDDNCNGDLYPKSRLSCNRCNSADDPSCASNPAAPAICPTYSAADYCVSKLVDGIVYRDCATELKCDTQSTNSTCRQCSEDNCNTNVFASPVGASRNVRTLDSKISADSAYLECYQCAVDNCYAPTVETCASTSDKGQCYMYFEPQSSIATRMGCISSLAADATNNDGMNYFLCDGNFCNSYYNLPLATTCYVCNSAEDVNCAVDPTAINTQAMCNIQPHTECVSLVDEAGQTIRGCFSSLNNTEFVACNEATPEVVCRICTDDNCNGDLYPKSRLSCNRCNSADDPSCASNPAAPAICPTYSAADYCVSKLVDGIVYRDCATELKCDTQSTNSTCRQCSEANCNTNVFASPVGASRHARALDSSVDAANLECYHCAGDDCDDPTVEACANTSENEQCYIRLDANNDFVGMGCTSELGTETEIVALIKGKSVFVCSESNCNGYENLPQSNECNQCNSDEDIRCATQPQFAGRTVRCGNVPYTRCYERVSLANNGTTERGCLYELEGDDFYNCLTGEDANCRVCAENGCNLAIIPSNRTQCQRCNSETDSNCSNAPSALSVCPRFLADDSCVSFYEAGVTQRGCSSEFSCDARAVNCEICTEPGCNKANLQKKTDDLYGIFQELPLTCNICSGLDCIEGGQHLRVCEGDINQDCVTIFDALDNVVARGCEITVYEEYQSYCEMDPEWCFNCKSNGCNNITEVTSTQQCVYCDSARNPDCLTNVSAIKTTRRCIAGCVTALYESSPDEFQIARSCFEDLEFDDRNTCTKENNCVQCDEDGCNTAILPDEGRLSCLHCDGDDCDEPAPRDCIVYSENDQCYIYFDPDSLSAVRMGCRSSLPADAVNNDALHYFICDGDNCNNYDNLPPARICYVCNSAENVNCATEPSAITTQSRCQINPHTDCFSRVDEDGHTVRGCMSSLNNTEFLACNAAEPDEICRVCTESGCNGNLYPSNRQSCHRCNSAEDPTCESNPAAKSVCPLFDNNDYCVSKLIDGIVYRGCATEFECDSNSTSKTCRECFSDNCNTNTFEIPIGNPGYFQPLPLSCHHCEGTADCTDSAGELKQCENNIYQTCTTVFDKNTGFVTARGCSDSLEDECRYDSSSCYKCKSNSCNVATLEKEYIDCIYCDAQENGACVTNATAISRMRKCYKSCVTTLYNRTGDATPVRELIRTCLDDLEFADQEICVDGNDANCKACSSDRCNTDVVGTRISCYQCVGDECQDPQQKTCNAVSESDRCFVQYDETGSIVELGCQSKYDTDEVKELIVAQRLWLCEGENCNTIESTPSSQRCTICSSATDQACATSPSAVQSDTSCAKLPYTQCYSRILDSGYTERGCLSSLEGDDFYDCYSGTNSTKCLACVGANCNNQVFPTNRLSCHRCNSQQDPPCESSPDASSICPLYHPDDYCVTKLLNGNTYRGCSSELTCEGSNTQSCRSCAGEDNCNTINLESISIGEPGKYQDLPLNCYTCEADECYGTIGKVRVCQNNNLQICQTVFASNGTVMSRGCSDGVAATHNEYCETNPSSCLGCKSNGCNNATSLDQYVDCYSCDSAENGTCALNFDGASSRKRKCQGSCAVLLYPRSSVQDPSYELERTCLDDLDLDDREDCLAGKNDKCVPCTGALCNTATLPENRHSCYKCVDEDCTDYAVSECSAYHPNDQCYITFDSENSVLNMGCRSEFEQEVVTELIKQKVILLCDGKACNGPETIPTPKTCTVCDSTSNTNCATNPNLVSSQGRCTALPYTSCFARVDEDGHTTRGCLSNLPSNTFYGCLMGDDELCQTCTGDKCNGEDVFPSNRRQCQQCSSETDPRCRSIPNSNAYCPVYKQTDSCITNWYKGVTTRGCASSLECDDESNERSCRVCSTNGCNTVNIQKIEEQGEPGRWQDVPITCRTCEGAEDCKDLGIYRVCTGNAYQSCSTVFHENGTVIARGCTDAVENSNSALCNANSERCPRCNSNGCNSATSLSDYIDCYYCDADTNGNCVEGVSALTAKRQCNKYCMTALYPKFEETNPAYGLSRSCLDDLDLDDREECIAGTKEHCYACSGANCNTQLVSTPRLSCNVCKGDDCQDPQPAKCVNYRADDKCYTEFDEQRTVVGMGCRSEYSNAEADYLLQNKRLFYCDGDNCNTFDAIPTSQVCTICSSRTDVDCATHPESVTVGTSCALTPYTQCYSRVLTSGFTERGCLSSLYDDEFASCLNGTAAQCEACSGSYCNNKLYPDNRLSCHICDSASNLTCATLPDNVSICPLYADDDTCVTLYRDGATYRGCSSSIECDPNDPKACVQCVGNGCNSINLERLNDDNYGKWQDLPLTCLTCSNANECNSASATQSIVCENNNEQDCATVFRDGQVVARGCSDAIEQEYALLCNSNSNDCPHCKSNECNNATAQSQYTECIYCDTHKELSCLWEPQSSVHKTRLCQGSCMTALYPSDSSADPAYELIRTCLDDKEAADRTRCSTGREASCQSCTGSKCNSRPLPAERRSCYQCDGENCDEPEVNVCPLYKSGDKCYIWYDETNSVTQMGCLSSFHDQELEAIIATKRIHVCDGEACNSLEAIPTPQKCAVCDSNSEYACATNALEISTFNTCTQYPYTSCYTKLNRLDGSTSRGCLSELPTQDFVGCVLGNDTNCSTCSGEGCNREIFPAGRQQCYTCSSADDANCESNPTYLQPCPYVTETERCRTAFGGNVTVRGCSSEVLCDVNDSNCRSCYGTGCNQIDLAHRVEDDDVHGVWQELPLRCHTCEGEQCLYSLGPAYTCSGNVAQDCVTVFTDDGEVKRRGCYEDVEDYEQRYCRENPHLCFSCKSNECNDAWNTTDYVQCSYCSSEKDPECATNPANAVFAKRACQKECMVALKDSHVIRSCLDDKEVNHRYVCRANESGDECASCDTPDCNNFVFPADRQSCHVCSDATCTNTKAQYCDPYDHNDYCFAKYENGRPELLGCASSQNRDDLIAWQTQNKLYTCVDNDCNSAALLPTTGGSCLSCSSDQTPACAQSPATYTNTEACPPLDNQCVTYLSLGQTRRGCLSKLSQAEQSSCQAAGTCAVCIGNRCNNEIYPANRRRCHICNSTSDSNCAASPNSLQVCPVYLNNDECVTVRGQFIERGCLSQLSCDASDEFNCQVCGSDGCNIAELTGGALPATASLWMTSVFVIVAMLVHRFN